jgi:hypothetical protein
LNVRWHVAFGLIFTAGSVSHQSIMKLGRLTFLHLVIISSQASLERLHLVWCATTWCIWSLRNNVIFKGEPICLRNFLERIKYSSWLWFISRTIGVVEIYATGVLML